MVDRDGGSSLPKSFKEVGREAASALVDFKSEQSEIGLREHGPPRRRRPTQRRTGSVFQDPRDFGLNPNTYEPVAPLIPSQTASLPIRPLALPAVRAVAPRHTPRRHGSRAAQPVSASFTSGAAQARYSPSVQAAAAELKLDIPKPIGPLETTSRRLATTTSAPAQARYSPSVQAAAAELRLDTPKPIDPLETTSRRLVTATSAPAPSLPRVATSIPPRAGLPPIPQLRAARAGPSDAGLSPIPSSSRQQTGQSMVGSPLARLQACTFETQQATSDTPRAASPVGGGGSLIGPGAPVDQPALHWGPRTPRTVCYYQTIEEKQKGKSPRSGAETRSDPSRGAGPQGRRGPFSNTESTGDPSQRRQSQSSGRPRMRASKVADPYPEMLMFEIDLMRRKLEKAQEQGSGPDLVDMFAAVSTRISDISHHLSQVLEDPPIETEDELTKRTGRLPEYPEKITAILRRFGTPLKCREIFRRHLRKLVTAWTVDAPRQELITHYRRIIMRLHMEIESEHAGGGGAAAASAGASGGAVGGASAGAGRSSATGVVGGSSRGGGGWRFSAEDFLDAGSDAQLSSHGRVSETTTGRGFHGAKNATCRERNFG